MRKQLVGLALALTLLAPGLAVAQTPVVPGNFAAPAAPGQQQQWLQYSATNPLYVSGFAATGFTPSASGATGTPLPVTGSSNTGTLPTGTLVILTNAGTQTAYCALGASATTASQPIVGGGSFAFTVGSATQFSCITASGTTTIHSLGGSGTPAFSGGGGGAASGTLYVTTPTFSNGTITTTNTWQSLLTTDALRRSCQAQNQGTHTMFFQVTSANTAPTGTAAAVQIAAGQTVVCNDYIGDVMQGYVWITGTAADPYQVTSFH